jgi:hypothetical protein
VFFVRLVQYGRESHCSRRAYWERTLTPRPAPSFNPLFGSRPQLSSPAGDADKENISLSSPSLILPIQLSPCCVVRLAISFFASTMASIFSSNVSEQIILCTNTFFVCPMRNARSTACTSAELFHHRSNKMTDGAQERRSVSNENTTSVGT